MQTTKHQLIDELLDKTHQAAQAIIQLKELPSDALNYKSHAKEWSILECIEHLNLYGEFYLPEIERNIIKAKNESGDLPYKGGFWGNFFVNSIRVENTKKMKSPKMMQPEKSDLSSTTLDQFLKQLERLQALLNQARTVNLKSVKTKISLTKFLKLRLGDTLRFLVHHNERHVQQALNMQQKFPDLIYEKK